MCPRHDRPRRRTPAAALVIPLAASSGAYPGRGCKGTDYIEGRRLLMWRTSLPLQDSPHYGSVARKVLHAATVHADMSVGSPRHAAWVALLYGKSDTRYTLAI
jgi:hypothetical protein